MVLALKVQVWSKLYIEATVRSVKLSVAVSVSVSTIFSVSISVSKIYIFPFSVLVSVSNIREQESRSRLMRLYLFSLGLACWDCTCSVSVLVSNLKNWSPRSLIDGQKYEHTLGLKLFVNTEKLLVTPRFYEWKHMGQDTWTLHDGTKITIHVNRWYLVP